jgi:hypothetical protein
MEPSMLDGVGASLVHGVTAGDIFQDILIAICPHPDLAAAQPLSGRIVSLAQADGAQNLMGAATQRLQHRDRFRWRGWLAQHSPIERHDRVGSQHCGLRKCLEDGLRFGQTQSADEGLGRFFRSRRFIDVRRDAQKV